MRKISIFLFLLFTPVFSFAVNNSFIGLLGDALNILGLLARIVVAATVVAFFYGLFLFVFNPDKQEEGKNAMIWGIVALTVMVSIWGLVSLLQNIFNIGNTSNIDLPELPSVKY